MKITVLSFGKLKTPGFRATADYYLRGLKGFHPSEEVELKPLPPKQGEWEKTKSQEAEMLTKRFPERGEVFLLDALGESWTTEQWSQNLAHCFNSNRAPIFVIGSSLGLSPSLQGKRLCLGPQTMSHELARVVLLEQLYRSMALLKGHPYHHA